MRLLTPVTTDPDRVFPGLGAYSDAMARHCPYLRPWISRCLTTWTGYAAGPEDCPALLGLLVQTAETVRDARRTSGPLACANIAVIGPSDIPAAQSVLDWPHWIARNLYASVGLMIGKFWIGEQEDDKTGQPIMSPPVSFFSIRHSFPIKDARFLGTLPEVAAALAASVDDDRDVLAEQLGVACSPEAATLAYDTLQSKFPTPARNTAGLPV